MTGIITTITMKGTGTTRGSERVGGDRMTL
jgi:hypothetical protein